VLGERHHPVRPGGDAEPVALGPQPVQRGPADRVRGTALADVDVAAADGEDLGTDDASRIS
jgi:hypothetical protein